MKKKLFATLALVVALTFAGCQTAGTGGGSGTTALEMTGTSVVALGNTFNSVSAVVTAKCKAKEYTVETCTNYRVFGEKFKLSYPAAKDLWNAARRFNDSGLTTDATSALLKLAAALAPFVTMTGVK